MGNASAFEMDALDTRIRELVAYARERDGEDRTLLFRNLVDLFLTGKAPRKQPTRDQLLDVIEALIPHVEPDGRRTVAELVAQMSEPPLDLVCRLAKDRPHLVGDLLRSTAFDEADIVELINCTGRDHHHVIASRNDLSANVWIALARAAPVAPPFDNQSTLALWRDDLGAFGQGQSSETVTPFRDPANLETTQPAVSGGDTTVKTQPTFVAADGLSRSSTQADDGGKTSQLRILRTDKDLIADRIEKASLQMQTGADIELDPATTEWGSTSGESHNPAIVSPGAEQNPASVQDVGGGWQWCSDRDGLVTAVSPRGQRLFDPNARLIGATILDMLGLNAKLGHPVSRAFQRRSTIHDAPLTLETKDGTNRFWTMEATPVFSSHGGLFEGYQGIMQPVTASAENELPLNAASPASTPLFTEEQAPHTNGVAEPVARSGNASTASDTLMDENIDRTLTPPPSSRPAQKPSADKTTKTGPSSDQIKTIATDLIRDMISDSVAKALNPNGLIATNSDTSAIPRSEGEKTGIEPDQAKSSPKAPEHTERADELAATLHILEQALSTMVISGQTAKNSALRLQTEIATACLKTLKEQIGAAGSHTKNNSKS